ncbi:MAG TPA: cyanophycin synthetase, partial [Gemmatimonadales bacterium]|nr:cyanophycin synthetase [Gemmatimonadales bacterium]
AVVNNVEPDHLECYGSVGALEEAFAEFAGRARRVIASAEDPGAQRVVRALKVPVWTVGTESGDVRIRNAHFSATGSTAQVKLPNGDTVALTLQVPGAHNVRNAGVALAAVHAVGANVRTAAAALAEFRGVARRFERLGEVNGVMVVDDYAHHPTEVAATLAGARQAFPDRRVVAVFQPHLYSRTAAHGKALGQALSAADVAVVAPIYGAREAPLAGVTSDLVIDAARTAGTETVKVSDRAQLTDVVAGLLKPGDLLLTMGAGDVTRVGPEILMARRRERSVR